ncbi:MAG: class I SAM-dependent methyltransferase [Betaproteobacteria bacterium]|nr:class I SAM-dependent methyltransferase [Betaproteobacteria bacterium]
MPRARQTLSITAFALVFACGFLQATPAHAQTQTQTQTSPDFKPQVGQAGKDVVWVPTSQALVDRMLDISKVTAADYVIDLGSGDGRTVITAVKRGARALGIEYNPDMVELAKRTAAAEGVGDKAIFMKADIFETDFSQASVITMFLLPSINLKLRPKILDLKPGTRIVSNTFTMDTWEDDDTASVESKDCSYYCTAHLWIVPAKVQGTWRSDKGDITFKQEFQKLFGSMASGSNVAQIVSGRMRGDVIVFSSGGEEYRGRVTGNTMEGTSKSGARWQAARTGN